MWFAPSQLAAVARLQRLRAGFGLNYAALGLVVDLLDRIARLGGRATPARHHDRIDRSTTMDMNRLTQKSQEALHDAQTKALRFGHTEVDGEHLLLALLDQPDGLVPRLMTQAGADADRLRGGPGSRAVAAATCVGARARRPARCSSPSGSPACSMPPTARPSA